MKAEEIYDTVNMILDNTASWFPVLQMENRELTLKIFNYVVNQAQLQFIDRCVKGGDINAIRTLQVHRTNIPVNIQANTGNDYEILFDFVPNQEFPPEMLYFRGVYFSELEVEKVHLNSLDEDAVLGISNNKMIIPTYVTPYRYYEIKDNIRESGNDIKAFDFIYTVIAREPSKGMVMPFPMPELLDRQGHCVVFRINNKDYFRRGTINMHVIYIRKPKRFNYEKHQSQNNYTLEIPEEYHYDVVFNVVSLIDAIDVNELGRFPVDKYSIDIGKVANV